MDLMRIDGIDVTTALAVISETGVDMSRFATVGHFTSWLGLCPGTKITGGKVMSDKRHHPRRTGKGNCETGRRAKARQTASLVRHDLADRFEGRLLMIDAAATARCFNPWKKT